MAFHELLILGSDPVSSVVRNEHGARLAAQRLPNGGEGPVREISNGERVDEPVEPNGTARIHQAGPIEYTILGRICQRLGSIDQHQLPLVCHRQVARGRRPPGQPVDESQAREEQDGRFGSSPQRCQQVPPEAHHGDECLGHHQDQVVGEGRRIGQ